MKKHIVFCVLFLIGFSLSAQVPIEALEYHYTKDSVLNPRIMGPELVCLGMTQQYQAGNCFPQEKTKWEVLGDAVSVRTVYTDHRLEVKFVRAGKARLVLERFSDWGQGKDTFEVEVRPGPSVGFKGDTTLCPGDSLVLEVDEAFPSFKWSDGYPENRRIVTENGLYRVSVKDSEGCATVGSIAVEVATKPDIDLGGDQVTCEGRAPILKAGRGYTTYLWQGGTTEPTYQVKEPGLHWVLVSNQCGMLGGDSIQIRPAQVQEVNLGSDRFACQYDSLVLDAGANFDRYEWQDGSYSRFMPVDKTDTYWVDAIDSRGCKVRGTIRVEVEKCESALDIPKAFSPNGDGINDIFKPRNLQGIRSLGMQILDPGGLIVYFSANLTAAWDGRFKGEPLKSGEYSYSIQYRDSSGKRKFEAGSVVKR